MRYAEPHQRASSSQPPDACPPSGSSGPAPCRTASSGNASRNKWYLLVKGIATDNGYGESIDASRAGRIAQAFRPPLRFAQVHTAGFYDDAGSAPTATPPSATSTGMCPTPDTVTVFTGTARAWTRTGRR